MDDANGNILERPWLQLVRDKPCEEPKTHDLDVKTHDRRDCSHMRLEVDDVLRRVTCKQCGEKLDPIQCLISFSRWMKELDWKVKAIREFEEKQASERNREVTKKKKHLIELLGEVESKNWGESCGESFGRMWIVTFTRRDTGKTIKTSRDGRFWRRAADGFEEISPEQAKAESEPTTKPAD